MGQYSKRLKNKLNKLINEIAENPSFWVRNSRTDFARNRKITIRDLIRILLSAGGNSMNKELYDYFKLSDKTVSAAFVQQRDKLLPDALDYLLHEFYSVCYDVKLYNGYRLFAVDGSTMTYNGSPDDGTYVPKSGKGVNQFHANAMYDLLNRVYADIIVQPKPHTNEPEAAWKMMERLSLTDKTIMIADRGYGGVNLIEHINRIPNADYLIRVKNGLWKEIRDLPMVDLDIEITINLRTTQTNVDKEAYASGDAKWVAGHGKYKKLQTATWDFESPYSLKVRIVRFKMSENTWETIATNLPKDKFPPSVLKYLYHLRCYL